MCNSYSGQEEFAFDMPYQAATAEAVSPQRMLDLFQTPLHKNGLGSLNFGPCTSVVNGKRKANESSSTYPLKEVPIKVQG
jgi:hypothetical protein